MGEGDDTNLNLKLFLPRNPLKNTDQNDHSKNKNYRHSRDLHIKLSLQNMLLSFFCGFSSKKFLVVNALCLVWRSSHCTLQCL